MKKIHLILTCSFFSLTICAQVPVTEVQPIKVITAEDIGKIPSGRGVWQYLLRENLSFASRDNSYGDADLGTSSSTGINLGTNYFVTDHIAIGTELSFGSDKTESVLDFITKDSRWMAYANLTYQTQLGNNFNLYVRPSVGFGGMKYKETYQGNTNTDEMDLFGVKVELGAPISLFNSGAIALTPEIQYRYRTGDFEGGEEKDGQFGLGLFLESYLRCNQMGCDKGRRYSTNMYDRGSLYLGYDTKGMVSFGNTKLSLDDYPDEEDEEDYFRAKMEAEFMYYVLPNLAVGSIVNFRQQHNEVKVSDVEQTNTSWYLQPTFEVNLPGKSAINNIFLRGGVGFGGQTFKYSNPVTSGKDKCNIMAYDIGVGYNLFYSPRLSLTPMVHYRSEKLDFDSAPEDEKNKGIGIQLGVRAFF